MVDMKHLSQITLEFPLSHSAIASVCDLTTLSSSAISFPAATAKWMVPYVAAWLIVEHNSVILRFFDLHASKKQCVILRCLQLTLDMTS